MVKGNQVSPAKGKKEDARYQTDVPRTRRSFFQSDITGNRRPPPMFQPRLYPPRYPLIRAMDVFSKSGKRNEKKKKKNVLLLLLHLIEFETFLPFEFSFRSTITEGIEESIV